MDRMFGSIRVADRCLTDWHRIDIVEIDEPCAHEVQFGGLCAECGKDMTE